MELSEELANLDKKLAEAEAERDRLAARIVGLSAERAALAAAISANESTAGESGLPSLAGVTKDRAIVALLEDVQEPLRIAEIVTGLEARGRSGESYNGVSVYLDTLLKQRRVTRVERGLYTVPQRVAGEPIAVAG